MKSRIYAIAWMLFATQAAAQDYPTKPILFVIPFASGGDSDLSGRNVAHHASKYLNNRPIVSLNRVGASGAIGATAVRNATPDGYTLLVARIATPLILARGRPRKPERVLICTAVGEPGKADIRAGGWLARRLGAEATLLHAARPGSKPQPIVQSHLERGVATLRELEVPSRFAVREAESPIGAILAELQEHPHDIVVVGAPPPPARGFLRAEHVTRQVLRQCGCSVLVVPQGSW